MPQRTGAPPAREVLDMSSGVTTQKPPLTLASSVRPFLTMRSLPLAAALLSVALPLPGLRAGWMIDGYLHRANLLERSRVRDLLGAPPEMFRLFRGDPKRTGRLM